MTKTTKINLNELSPSVGREMIMAAAYPWFPGHKA